MRNPAGLLNIDGAVVIDLETLGTSEGSIIATIGAVRIKGGEVGTQGGFYERIDIASCETEGMTMDADTVLWWLRQSEAARLEIFEPTGRIGIRHVLAGFQGWLGRNWRIEAGLWGNSCSFDNQLLRRAYELCGMKCPFSYREDRCFRTVKKMLPEMEMVHEGEPHVAIHDAISEAKHLVNMANVLSGEGGSDGSDGFVGEARL